MSSKIKCELCKKQYNKNDINLIDTKAIFAGSDIIWGYCIINYCNYAKCPHCNEYKLLVSMEKKKSVFMTRGS